jgi:hypothetical protein
MNERHTHTHTKFSNTHTHTHTHQAIVLLCVLFLGDKHAHVDCFVELGFLVGLRVCVCVCVQAYECLASARVPP